MIDTTKLFYAGYETDVVRERFGRLDEMFLSLADGLGLQPEEWQCLMDCLNGVMFEHQITLQPGAIEGEIVDVAYLEPERFNRWGVDLATLKAKIEPLSALQRLAICYKVHWLFELPSDLFERWIYPEHVETN